MWFEVALVLVLGIPAVLLNLHRPTVAIFVGVSTVLCALNFMLVPPEEGEEDDGSKD